ncbi:transferase family protein [Martensiomyces pterosporus]|nr:transferase family protein [Martensiomyces pterosporus]
MEQLATVVRSQAIPLSAIDMLVGVIRIPYIFFYENTSGAGDFMPSEPLRTSFYLALQHFPILVGRLRSTKYGRFDMVVDSGNLNMPKYVETASSLHYKDIKSAGFGKDKWPSDIAAINAFLVPDLRGEIKTTHVHIVRLKDNSGLVLFLGISHSVVDGVGYYAFLNHWAKLCKAMRNVAARVPEPRFVFDRSLIQKNLPTARKQIDADTYNMFTQSNIVARWLAWLLPEIRGCALGVFSIVMQCETHVFHIPKATLETLRASVSEFVPKGTRVSDNDLLIALLAKTYVQAHCICEAVLSWISWMEERHQTVFACDIRHRIGISDKNYAGNALISPCISNAFDDLLAPTTAESLARVVANVRKCVDALDAPYAGSFVDMIDSDPASFTKPVARFLNCPAILVTSNHTRFRMFEADFGDGCQEWVSFINMTPGIAVFMPCPPPTKGVNISMGLDAPTFREMVENEFWMKNAIQIS